MPATCKYYPLTGMEEAVRQQLVDDHFLFVSGDRNLQVAGMERDWPEGRGIFHNEAKTFLLWVNEEDQTRIISMEKGGDVKGVFGRLARGIKAVGDSVKAESGKDFALDERYGYIHSCPTNLGTGMRASVHVDLPGWTKEGLPALQKRCDELAWINLLRCNTASYLYWTSHPPKKSLEGVSWGMARTSHPPKKSLEGVSWGMAR